MKIQNMPTLCAGLRTGGGVGCASVKFRMSSLGWVMCVAAVLRGAATRIDELNLREVLPSAWSVLPHNGLAPWRDTE